MRQPRRDSDSPADWIPVPLAVLDRLTALGVSVPEATERAGLSMDALSGPRGGLTTKQFFALWRGLGEVSERRDLGLLLGSEALAHGYSVISAAALHAASVEQALKTVARYKRLICPELVEVETQGPELTVSFRWILADEDVPRLLVDSAFASFVSLLRHGTATPVTPLRVELARRREDAKLLASHFGCAIRFSMPVDRLVFDKRVLSLPFVTRDAAILAGLTPGLEAELTRRFKRNGIGTEVRLAMARHICGTRPSVREISRRMHLSARTLQRRLQAQGTSYQRELDDVRERMARRLLAQTDLQPLEVSFLLGFEEPNSFLRAFRGWVGVTPTRWRNGRSRSLGTGRAAAGLSLRSAAS